MRVHTPLGKSSVDDDHDCVLVFFLFQTFRSRWLLASGRLATTLSGCGADRMEEEEEEERHGVPPAEACFWRWAGCSLPELWRNC